MVFTFFTTSILINTNMYNHVYIGFGTFGEGGLRGLGPGLLLCAGFQGWSCALTPDMPFIRWGVDAVAIQTERKIFMLLIRMVEVLSFGNLLPFFLLPGNCIFAKLVMGTSFLASPAAGT